MLGVYQDITDRKRLEEQLRQAQKMEAVGRLAGGIAHDFNNLLTIIRGNADLLAFAARRYRSAAELIDDLRLAADRAAALVRQFLMFSRRQPTRPEVVDLNAVVVATGRTVAPAARRADRRRDAGSRRAGHRSGPTAATSNRWSMNLAVNAARRHARAAAS